MTSTTVAAIVNVTVLATAVQRRGRGKSCAKFLNRPIPRPRGA